jgi:hypothetical protein
MNEVECWYHYFLDRQACNNYAAYFFLAHIGSILTKVWVSGWLLPPQVFKIFLIFRTRVLFYDEFKQKPRYIRVVRDCSHVKDLDDPGKSHLAMVSDGTYPVHGVSSV